MMNAKAQRRQRQQKEKEYSPRIRADDTDKRKDPDLIRVIGVNPRLKSLSLLPSSMDFQKASAQASDDAGYKCRHHSRRLPIGRLSHSSEKPCATATPAPHSGHRPIEARRS